MQNFQRKILMMQNVVLISVGSTVLNQLCDRGLRNVVSSHVHLMRLGMDPGVILVTGENSR